MVLMRLFKCCLPFGRRKVSTTSPSSSVSGPGSRHEGEEVPYSIDNPTAAISNQPMPTTVEEGSKMSKESEERQKQPTAHEANGDNDEKLIDVEGDDVESEVSAKSPGSSTIERGPEPTTEKKSSASSSSENATTPERMPSVPRGVTILSELKTLAEKSKHACPLFEKISFFTGDITKIQVDAIVNAANAGLHGGGGVDGAIHRAAGHAALQAECRKQRRPVETGGAVATDACRLSTHVKRIIHAVGPMAYGNFSRSAPALRKQLIACYANSVAIAEREGLRSLAFPCISTGIYGYPNEDAAFQVMKYFHNYFKKEENRDKLDRIVLCLFMDIDKGCFSEIAKAYMEDQTILERNLSPSDVSKLVRGEYSDNEEVDDEGQVSDEIEKNESGGEEDEGEWEQKPKEEKKEAEQKKTKEEEKEGEKKTKEEKEEGEPSSKTEEKEESEAAKETEERDEKVNNEKENGGETPERPSDDNWEEMPEMLKTEEVKENHRKRKQSEKEVENKERKPKVSPPSKVSKKKENSDEA